GFRVPDAVVTLANRLLPALEVDVPAARSLRHDGWLRITQATDLDAQAVTEVRGALDHDGSVGVIAAAGAVPRMSVALRDDRLDARHRCSLLQSLTTVEPHSNSNHRDRH